LGPQLDVAITARRLPSIPQTCFQEDQLSKQMDDPWEKISN
jgi:hypothetical protein